MFPNTINSEHFNSGYRISKNSKSPKAVKYLPSSTAVKIRNTFQRKTIFNPSGGNSFEHVFDGSSKKRIVPPLEASTPKKSKYKWENNSASQARPSPALHDATSSFNRINENRVASSNLLNKNELRNEINNHRSCTPFNRVISKGWFSQAVCDIKCLNSGMQLDLQSCCFIAPKFVPLNTLSWCRLSNDGLPKKIKKMDFENQNLLVTLSKHKLVRKPERGIARSEVRKVDSSLVLSTRRKLIRKAEPKPTINLIYKPAVEQNTAGQQSSVANLVLDSKIPVNQTSEPSPLLVLTRSKLIRKQEMSSKGAENKMVGELPERLISVNCNKLIRSSLLKANVKPYKSVLYHMIQYRRRPYPGSSYVLLTRNKLIRRRKCKLKSWRRQSDGSPKAVKKLLSTKKTFVSVGSNKLIRKSLFSKTNKIAAKNIETTASPFRKTILARVLNSPSKRIQRFTNHLSRLNLRYMAGQKMYSKMKRFPNRCKNNRRVLRNKMCPMYRRRGVCLKNSKKTCPMLHDPKYVVLCQKSLKGSCEDATCTLSHEIIAEKVPLCVHYLHDKCTAEECSYLHAKPQASAPICAQYLRGYCELAVKCPNWHVYACPDFKSCEKCEKGEKCRLPHRSIAYFENNLVEVEDEDEPNWRYFEKPDLSDKDHESISIIPQREAMGLLPDFIPL